MLKPNGKECKEKENVAKGSAFLNICIKCQELES